MYSKDFEIRWSDVDANCHLGNSAYVNFMSHTRMGFFTDLGLSLSALQELAIGPVVFYEHIYYFREALLGTTITVSLELTGLAADGRFFEFHHDFYDRDGKHLAHCEMMGAWIGMQSRKLTSLAPELLQKLEAVERPEHFRILTKEDTRKYSKKPKNLV
jgi:acyl-CoA thioester hydrolase